jgi:hypothetical protein
LLRIDDDLPNVDGTGASYDSEWGPSAGVYADSFWSHVDSRLDEPNPPPVVRLADLVALAPIVLCVVSYAVLLLRGWALVGRSKRPLLEAKAADTPVLLCTDANAPVVEYAPSYTPTDGVSDPGPSKTDVRALVPMEWRLAVDLEEELKAPGRADE